MQLTCRNCQQSFTVVERDQVFYSRIDVPPPTLCPTCRQQRRAAFRNERSLYQDTCDRTGAPIISMYRPDTKATVYSSDAWWSDDWNPLSYGRDIDFTRPFFEQFRELQLAVPRLALYTKNSENSAFANHCDSVKNGYLTVDTGFSEDILYSKWIVRCRDIVDGYQLENSERCYETLYSVNAYDVMYSHFADESVESSFLYNCKGAHNAFMCTNLRNPKHTFKNVQYSQKDYEQHIATYDLGSYQSLQKAIKDFAVLKQQAIRKPTEQINCEDSSGDYLYNCQNVYQSYGVVESQNSSYCYDAGWLKDCYDVYEPAFECELQYESHACNRGQQLISCSVCYDIHHCSYSEMCHNASYLFGCIGLRHKQYCILNKQYTKEEYEVLAIKLIEHMKQTGEWGEFFPVELSFFTYNESAAPEFSPMSKADVMAKGWQWYESTHDYKPQTVEIPDHIQDVSESILGEVLACIRCQKNYKIVAQELAFYKEHRLPIPRLCSTCRYHDRLQTKNPARLYNRSCSKCSSSIETTYAPDRPEIVYCQDCYLAEIY